VRLGIPYAVVGFVLSLSFGVVARQAGFSAGQAIAASAFVFAGSAQFAALAVFAAGGTLIAAVAAAAMMNGRFLAMGVALAPSLPGGPVKRGLQGQTVVDASWALANNGDGTFDRWLLFRHHGTPVRHVGARTVVGVYGGDLLGDPNRLGLDAVFPTFFLALVLAEIRDPTSRRVALLGA
jgi:predicted branched-subunit amino acid permease